LTSALQPLHPRAESTAQASTALAGAAPREARVRLLGLLANLFTFSACALVLMYLAWTQRRERASLRAQTALIISLDARYE
jgi:hypothetical protein